jgi:hypothetical protein
MVVLANIIAYLYILTAIGFFAAIGGIAFAGYKFYKLAMRVKAMSEGPKNAGLEIFRVGKGIALRDAAHIRAIGKSGRSAYQTIITTKEDLFGTAKSIDVDEAKEAATSAREAIVSMFSNVSMGLALAKQIMSIFSQANQNEESPEGA